MIEQLRNYFLDRVKHFCIDDSNIYPNTEGHLRFMMYDNCSVAINVDGSHVNFFACFGGYGDLMVRASLLSTFTGRGSDFVEKIVLAELDKQVRLRILDKFLVAKGWQHPVEP